MSDLRMLCVNHDFDETMKTMTTMHIPMHDPA